MKSLVVSLFVGEFEIDGFVPLLHEFKVHDQAAYPAVAVNERMEPFEVDMKPWDGFYRMGAFLGSVVIP